MRILDLGIEEFRNLGIKSDKILPIPQSLNSEFLNYTKIHSRVCLMIK